MLNYEDERWQNLKSGYGYFYDPIPALKNLEKGVNIDETWCELFNELHHQGDIGDVAYAVLPHLVRIYSQNHHPIHQINLYGLACVIETERHRRTNPPVPEWLAAAYFEAWGKLFALALEAIQTCPSELANQEFFQQLLAVMALGKGYIQLGALISFASQAELAEYLEEHWAWLELYDQAK